MASAEDTALGWVRYVCNALVRMGTAPSLVVNGKGDATEAEELDCAVEVCSALVRIGMTPPFKEVAKMVEEGELTDEE